MSQWPEAIVRIKPILPEALVVLGAISCFFAVFQFVHGLQPRGPGQHDSWALGTGVAFLAIGLAWLGCRTLIANKDAARSLGRLNSLEATWDGTFEQPNLSGRMVATLKIERHRISGKADLHYENEGEKECLTLMLTQGEVLHDRFLQLNYRERQDWSTVQFGALIVKLSPGADLMSGSYIGYGKRSETIVQGTVMLRKVETEARPAPHG